MYLLTVRWVRQGRREWAFWWIFFHGKNITREPTAADHVSFVHYDLKHIGVTGYMRSCGEHQWFLNYVPVHKLEQVTEILVYHGFEIVQHQEQV
jgi:hypothetical protein